MRTGRSLTICRSQLPGGICSGGCLLWGEGCLLWGVCSGGEVSALVGGVCSRGCLLPGCLLWGVCSGGCLLWGVCSRLCLLQGVCPGGVCSGGWHPIMHWGRHPPVNWMTNRCKNITLATTSLRSVISSSAAMPAVIWRIALNATPAAFL